MVQERHEKLEAWEHEFEEKLKKHEADKESKQKN
jgi:hypothetical protein